ncbi:MAG TPA: ribosome-binding factor A [Candidatus Paceibacterota bacterium]
MKTPNRHKDEKFASLISQFAAEYISLESGKDSLITVTKAEVYNKGRYATIFFTALPQEKEKAALEFLKRKRNDFRKFVMGKKSFGFTPKIDFEVDYGEHNRQRIDELLNIESLKNNS